MKTYKTLLAKVFKSKYLIIINLLFFFIYGQLYGQQNTETPVAHNEVEDLNFIKKASSDKVKNFLFETLYKKPEKVIQYNALYLERGKKTMNDTIKYISYYCLSQYYHHKLSKYPTAILYADSALIAANNIGNPIKIIRTLNLKGNSEFEMGNYEHTLKLYTEAYKLSKKNKLYAEEIYTIGHIGHIKKELKEYKEGIEIYENVLKLLNTETYKQIDSYNGSYINALNVLGICHRELGNTKKAITFFNEGLSLIEKIGVDTFKRDQAMLLSNMSKSYINQGDYDVALDLLYIAKDIFIKENKPGNHIYFHICFFMAEALKGQHNYKEALAVLEEALLEAEEDIYSDIFIDISDLAADLGNKLKDVDKELKYSRLRNKISDSIHLENVLTRNLINEELTEENEELSLDNETKSEKLVRTRIIIFILLLSLLTTLLVYINNHSRNRKKFKKLLDTIAADKQNKMESRVTVSDEKVNKILTQLQKLEEKQFFLKKDCSLHNTATKLKTNTSYLSKVVNAYKQKTFKEYINSLRIAFVLDQIKENPHFRLYTIKAIAEETGYKSVNTLNQTFKKQTQLSLSYYIKQFNKAS